MTIRLFTVGIFGPFFNHFPFHFVSIFLKIESENERKINAKWNPNLAFAKIDLNNQGGTGIEILDRRPVS